MKKLALIIVIFILPLILLSQNSIKLKVEKNSSIRIDMKAHVPNTIITIDNGHTLETKFVGIDWTGFTYYDTYGDDFTITGDLQRIDISDNAPKIKEVHIDMKSLTFVWAFSNLLRTITFGENINLEFIACSDNKINKLDFTNCPKIKTIFCFANNLSDCGLDSVFNTLPDRNSTNFGVIFIKDKTKTNPGTDGCTTPLANTRNWKTYDFNGSLSSAFEISNTVFTCQNGISTKDNEIARLEVFPNPTKDVLFINSDKSVASIDIFDNQGRIVMSGKYEKDGINVAKLKKGMYVLRIKTKEDLIINCKFIKN